MLDSETTQTTPARLDWRILATALADQATGATLANSSGGRSR